MIKEDDDVIKIRKYHYFEDEDIVVYDLDSIKEEFEEKMKELEAHNEKVMENE